MVSVVKAPSSGLVRGSLRDSESLKEAFTDLGWGQPQADAGRGPSESRVLLLRSCSARAEPLNRAGSYVSICSLVTSKVQFRTHSSGFNAISGGFRAPSYPAESRWRGFRLHLAAGKCPAGARRRRADGRARRHRACRGLHAGEPVVRPLSGDAARRTGLQRPCGDQAAFGSVGLPAARRRGHPSSLRDRRPVHGRRRPQLVRRAPGVEQGTARRVARGQGGPLADLSHALGLAVLPRARRRVHRLRRLPLLGNGAHQPEPAFTCSPANSVTSRTARPARSATTPGRTQGTPGTPGRLTPSASRRRAAAGGSIRNGTITATIRWTISAVSSPSAPRRCRR